MEAGGHSPSYAKPSLFRVRDDLFLLMANHEYGYRGTDVRDVSRATLHARKELHALIDGLRGTGGVWKNLRLVATAEQIGVREGRRLRGLYTLTAEDLREGRRFDDAVCRATFGVDVHALDPKKTKGIEAQPWKAKPYDIPLRALIAKDVKGLLFAGRSGAGKSTILRTISGLLRAKTGNILFEGKSISSMPAEDIVKLGVSQVPEGRRIFANMTVAENLELGAYIRKDRSGIAKDIAKVFDRFSRLGERRTQIAGTLSGGEQQMLAIGRGLMSQPRLMLLDEPSMGLAPLLVKEIFSIIKEINESGTTILLVEQNAHMALSIAHQAYVLETGRITLAGTAKELSESEAVRKAYLGG